MGKSWFEPSGGPGGGRSPGLLPKSLNVVSLSHSVLMPKLLLCSSTCLKQASHPPNNAVSSNTTPSYQLTKVIYLESGLMCTVWRCCVERGDLSTCILQFGNIALIRTFMERLINKWEVAYWGPSVELLPSSALWQVVQYISWLYVHVF